MKRTITLSIAAALLAASTIAGSAAAAGRPDVACMQAGIKTLQSVRLLDDVARGGIAIETAVSLGVTVRPGRTSPGSRTPSPSRCCWPTTGPVRAARSCTPGARTDEPRVRLLPSRQPDPPRRRRTMKTHRLHAEMLVDRPIDEVFAFFAKPENLGRITPGSLGFELLSTDTRMREGLEIDYRVRPLLGIPLGWRSRIAQDDPPHAFRDVQLKGPYRSWDHRHSFIAEGDRTRVIDDVVYSLPFGASVRLPTAQSCAGRSRRSSGTEPAPSAGSSRSRRPTIIR